MQQLLIMPAANGVLPRPDGGRITGMFVVEGGAGALMSRLEIGQEILACPWLLDRNVLYPIGVLVRILDIVPQTAVNEAGQELPVLMMELEGQGHARWHTLKRLGENVLSPDVERMNFAALRKEYPAISGAGWRPAGGYTEFRGRMDIPVTLYGADVQTGQEVRLSANLGGLVAEEQAHTIEHAAIRALSACSLCTPRTLLEAMEQETAELKQSLEVGFRFALPEVLGVTASGVCGNPMTNLAQFYLANEFVEQVSAGKNLQESLEQARRSTMSQITQDLGLTLDPGTRALQGLKKGMAHDDTPLKLELCKKVIRRFPPDPWS